MSAPKAPNKANMPTKALETSWKCEAAADEEPVGVEADAADEEPVTMALLDDAKLPEGWEELPPVGAADVDAGEEPEPPEPPPFLDTHEQTATAAEDAWMPVTAPQAETTQLRARELMADAAEVEHWQA
jgi:hypothetical protein